MEKKLSRIFDYQKFACNPRLQRAIDSTRRRPRELSLEEAERVSAAGSPYFQPTNDEKKDEHS